jgi:hypothetical protein
LPKKILKLCNAVLVAAVMMACDKRPSAYPQAPTPPAFPAQPNPEVAARAMADLEKRVQVEHEMRLATESRLKEQEAAKSRWQNMAMLAVTAALALLIVGSILGSRARHDTKK